jgi:hypothetical protein
MEFMDDKTILSKFEEYPKVSKGIANMLSMWRANQLEIGLNIESVSFKCSGQRVAFRVEFPGRDKIPRIVAYSGVNDPERGSPLIKGANQEDLKQLRYLLGIEDEDNPKPDWARELYENVTEDFYRDFINHALIWLTVVKRENISCPTGIQRFLVVG